LGLFVTNVRGESVHINRRCEEITGITRDQALGGAWTRSLHPEDAGAVLTRWKETLQSGTPFHSIHRFVRPDGATPTVSVHTAEMRDGGRLLGHVGTVEDVTLSRLAEERFELVVRGSSVALWDWDIRTGDVYYSPHFVEILGGDFPPLRATLLDRIHPGDRDAFEDNVREHLDHRWPHDVDVRLRGSDGDYRWFHATGQAVWDSSGTALRMAGCLVDITERKAAEAGLRRRSGELRTSQQRLALALDGSGLGLFDLNLDTGELYLSPSLEAMLGYEPNRMPLRRGFIPLMHPDDRDTARRAFREHLDEVTPHFETEYRLRVRSGEWKWILARGLVTSRDENGRPLRLVGTHTDISQRKQMEQNLVRAAFEASAAASAKSAFLATVSHEIRTPMNGILGMTGLLLDTPLSEEQRDYADSGRISADNLLKVINDILAFSKIEAGRIELEAVEFD
ncbi:MAG: PAS domain-containing protein, partial [Bryobacteraceae bacterium]